MKFATITTTHTNLPHPDGKARYFEVQAVAALGEDKDDWGERCIRQYRLEGGLGSKQMFTGAPTFFTKQGFGPIVS